MLRPFIAMQKAWSLDGFGARKRLIQFVKRKQLNSILWSKQRQAITYSKTNHFRAAITELPKLPLQILYLSIAPQSSLMLHFMNQLRGEAINAAFRWEESHWKIEWANRLREFKWYQTGMISAANNSCQFKTSVWLIELNYFSQIRQYMSSKNSKWSENNETTEMQVHTNALQCTRREMSVCLCNDVIVMCIEQQVNLSIARNCLSVNNWMM